MAMEAIGNITNLKEPGKQVNAQAKSVSLQENAEVRVETGKPDKMAEVIKSAQTRENTEAEEERLQPKNDQIKQAVERFNKSLPHSEAILGVHEKTNRITIKIVDRDTKEVIRELPPEKTLDMITKLWEMAGILVDEKR